MVGFVKWKSESYSRLVATGSPRYFGANTGGSCSSATTVVPSGRTRNVHRTATSQTSAPSRSLTQLPEAPNGVRLSTCHMVS